MPEQPQWSERTLDMPPQDPWADPPTAQVPPTAGRPLPPAGAPGVRPPGYSNPGHGSPGHRNPGQGHGSPGHGTPGADGRPGAAAPGAGPAPTAPFDASPFTRGRAQVTPRAPQPHTAEHEPTGTGWPGAEPPRRPMNWNPRELRRGGEWSSAALLFAFVCWGIWTISEGGEGWTTPIIVFILSVLVAVGLFALARVLGHVILEKQFGRVRRTARGAHLVAAVFLVGVGLAHLQQTGWVMDAYRWVVNLF